MLSRSEMNSMTHIAQRCSDLPLPLRNSHSFEVPVLKQENCGSSLHLFQSFLFQMVILSLSKQMLSICSNPLTIWWL